MTGREREVDGDCGEDIEKAAGMVVDGMCDSGRSEREDFPSPHYGSQETSAIWEAEGSSLTN